MNFKTILNYNFVKSKTVLKNLKRLLFFQLVKDNYFLMNFTLSDCDLFPETSIK